jgi:hypothetical protein
MIGDQIVIVDPRIDGNSGGSRGIARHCLADAIKGDARNDCACRGLNWPADHPTPRVGTLLAASCSHSMRVPASAVWGRMAARTCKRCDQIVELRDDDGPPGPLALQALAPLRGDACLA